MWSWRNQDEPLIPYDLELNQTMRTMENYGVPLTQMGWIHGWSRIEAFTGRWGTNQVHVENELDANLGLEPPASPRFQDYYRGNMNIPKSDGPIVLHPLPPRHTFVLMNSLMQMLTTRGLLSVPLSEYPHSHIAKLRLCAKFVWVDIILIWTSLGCKCFLYHWQEMLLHASLSYPTTLSILGIS